LVWTSLSNQNKKKKMKTLTVLTVLCVALAVAFALQIDLAPKSEFSHPQLEFAQHSGFVLVNKTYDANLFYWMFESQSSPSTDPVILWMTGGPGCSSELAVLFENGPYTVGSNNQLVPNPYSWNKRANVIYIDQPAGTGFSTTNKEYVRDEAQVGREMVTFLTGFFAKLPQFAKNPFYIIGESYGGHFVPTTAYYLLKAAEEGVVPVHLKGIGIGNGWVDPYHQYAGYGPFAYANNLISASVYRSINETVEQCQALLRGKHYNQASSVCGNVMGQVLQAAGNLNVYDIKLQCNPQPLCYNFDPITRYLNQASVRQQLGVNSTKPWSVCNFGVNGMFRADVEESFAWELPAILEKGIRVVVYSGDLDLICNWYGGRMWTDALKWSGQKGYNAAHWQKWGGYGEFKKYENFTFVRVFNAGHMVPHDQGAAALELANNLIWNKPF